MSHFSIKKKRVKTRTKKKFVTQQIISYKRKREVRKNIFFFIIFPLKKKREKEKKIEICILNKR